MRDCYLFSETAENLITTNERLYADKRPSWKP